ncbi:MAG: hypothetical protein AABX51_06420, partial [Nanoarchaeota archaeon]
SKELLKQLMKSGAVVLPRGTPVFRDALNSRPVSAIKKPRVKKENQEARRATKEVISSRLMTLQWLKRF